MLRKSWKRNFKISKKNCKKILTNEKEKILLITKKLSDYLGVKKFKYGELENEDKIGVVTGLAWTELEEKY